MLKVGQIYKEIKKPNWRKYDAEMFVISNISFNKVNIIYNDGTVDYVGYEWIKGDCELIAEYDTWQIAVNSKEFKNG